MIKTRMEQVENLRKIFSKKFLMKIQIMAMEDAIENSSNIEEALELIIEFDIDVFRVELYLGCGDDCECRYETLNDINISDVFKEIF